MKIRLDASSAVALAKTYPAPPANAGLVHADGYAQLSEEAFLRDFAGDIDPVTARALYAVQGRAAETIFAGPRDASGLAHQADHLSSLNQGSHD